MDGELRAVDGDLRAKESREKQSEVQVHAPRSSGSSRGAFLKICFAIKAERMMSPFSKLHENA